MPQRAWEQGWSGPTRLWAKENPTRPFPAQSRNQECRERNPAAVARLTLLLVLLLLSLLWMLPLLLRLRLER